MHFVVGFGLALFAIWGPPAEVPASMGGYFPKARFAGPVTALGPFALHNFMAAGMIFAGVPESSPFWPLVAGLGLA
jgi:hypothetical protein